MFVTALPTWLEAELPPLKEPSILTVEGDELIVTAPDGTRTVHSDLRAVQQAKGADDLKIMPEVYAKFGEEGLDDFALFFPVSKNFSGMLMSYTDEDRRASLERDFAYSLECAEAYAADPEDFLKAYNFIDHHPAFWLRHSDWHWSTASHCERLSHYVTKADGELVIGFETGSHVPGDEHTEGFTTHYHDYRLDVYADSFEHAYIKLAAAVAKFFAPDGSEYEDVEHEVPEWIRTVQERAAEAERLAAEDEELNG